jgi:hypothetical protein
MMIATELCELEVLRGIFNLAKENLTTEEVNKLFLDIDNKGRTVFHMAVKLW